MNDTVVFTILKRGNGVYRLITNHVIYRRLNTACITDIDILYESMEEISSIVNNECGKAVLFEIA